MNHLSFILSVFLLIFSSQQREDAGTVSKELLGPHDGSEVYLFTLTNKAGNVLKLTNYGARIVGVEVPDKNGKMENVVLGSYVLESILRDSFGGATVGRYANRIANGKFSLDGVEYNLPVNNKPNTLHGGPRGWYAKVWNAELINDKNKPAVRFSYESPDMEEGFPGTINMVVVFTWTNRNEIIIEYTASTDKKSVINVTNHAYFNLHGAGNGNIFDHEMTLKASAYTPFNSTMIPTGEIRPVKGTPFDFTSARTFGSRIGDTYEGSVFSGYDHNYVLDNKEKVDAVVYDPVSGRMLEMMTDQPAMQLYTGNGLMYKRQAETGGKQFRFRSGFCLESQHYPDGPNQPGFPSTVINPGEKFRSRTIYRFSIKK
ncbi:MAG: aldose epimerase family protein [Bacteroidales bacterium]|jgi:aldose 1-epimerase|nr:aldose epimerase family protein [Bacteroidales bacterium]